MIKKSKKIKVYPERSRKVIVALSGGVDSSVAAALLKKQGFNVVGVFMKFWSESDSKFDENRCCSSEAEKMARKVAKILKIPFYVFNFKKEFKKRIVDYFLKEYKTGVTPNPCVVCNKEIKFGLLLEKALALGADYIATGHYARLRNTKRYETTKMFSYIRKKFVFRSLIRARDKKKDQSYFLWMLSQKQLQHILFPIGDYKKSQVRLLAKKFGLPTFSRPESQEICFVNKTINEFLSRYLKQKSGNIIDVSGKIFGQHKGLAFYTIGQRKGIGLAGGPYYVLDKNIKKNLLIVTKNLKDLYKKELIARNVNWISGKEPKLPIKVRAKIRYRHKASSVIIYHLKSNIYYLVFDKPQKAITPGQSVVFYKGNELLGGGIISNS